LKQLMSSGEIFSRNLIKGGATGWTNVRQF